MSNHLTKSIGSLLIAGLLALPSLTQAQPTAHYVPGFGRYQSGDAAAARPLAAGLQLVLLCRPRERRPGQ